MEQPRFNPPPARAQDMGLVQFLRVLGDFIAEPRELANTKYLLDYGFICLTVYSYHRCELLVDRFLLHTYCLGWIEVAHWLHSTEQV